MLARYSSESLVEGDYRHIDILLALGDGVFGLQLCSLGIQQGEEVNYSFAIAQAGDLGRTLARTSLIVQFDESRLLRMVIRQRILRFFQGPEYGFFVEGQRLFGSGVRPAHASARPTQIERRPRKPGRNRPCTRVSGKKGASAPRYETNKSGNTHLGKETRDSNALTFGGRSQPSFRGTHVWPALQEFARVADGEGFCDRGISARCEIRIEFAGASSREYRQPVFRTSHI